jgi:hypothetical protein
MARIKPIARLQPGEGFIAATPEPRGTWTRSTTSIKRGQKGEFLFRQVMYSSVRTVVRSGTEDDSAK